MELLAYIRSSDEHAYDVDAAGRPEFFSLSALSARMAMTVFVGMASSKILFFSSGGSFTRGEFCSTAQSLAAILLECPFNLVMPVAEMGELGDTPWCAVCDDRAVGVERAWMTCRSVWQLLTACHMEGTLAELY